MDARRELIVDDTGWIVAAIVNLLVVVFLAQALMSYVILGAGVLFAWALGQGFVGAVLYFAAWFFLFPVMLVASTLVGFFTNRTLSRERREWENEERTRNPPCLQPSNPGHTANRPGRSLQMGKSPSPI